MPQYIDSFIHFVFLGFIALFPVVNPIGSAFILSPFFATLTRKERMRAVKKVALNAFVICVLTLLVGQWILKMFGITIPVIQLAGGIMICKIGWGYLADDSNSPTKNQSPEDSPINNLEEIEGKLFYPITFPMTTGAGTLAVLFTLSAHGSSKITFKYLMDTGALIVSVIGICIIIFIAYANANRLIKYIGSHNEKIVNRIMAFLIFCVGLQIAVEGITNLLKSTTP